jgi:SAM-dependent methyltransferase
MKIISDNPVAERVLDARNGELVYLGSSSTPDLWDALWSLDREAVEVAIAPSPGIDALAKFTQRFISPDEGPVVEGGCGKGQFVAALSRAGFQAIGIDFAPETVCALNTFAPQLDIRHGDLRAISLADASVAGYWSLGVIEHFWDGYEPLAREMSRIIQDGGFLFCSFPYMSPFRRAKACLGLYPEKNFHKEPAGFYQFALRQDLVVKRMADFGFKFVESAPSSALKGILGECGRFSFLLERLYYYPGTSIFIRAIRRGVETVLGLLGTSHSIQIVFQRQSRGTNCA